MAGELASKKPTVLLVDDERDERLLIRRELEASGISVDEADSGASAIAYLQNSKPDVILLDVMMPKEDGIEVCQQIRSSQEFNDVPVLMLTGLDGIDFIIRAFDAGATDFITKSSTIGLLSQRVKYAIRNSRKTTDLAQREIQIKKVHQVAKIGYLQMVVENCMLTLSDEALRLFNIERAEFDNSFSAFLDLIHLTDRETVKAAIDAALFKRDVLNIDHRVVMKDGSERYINLQGEVIFDQQGKPTNLLGVLQDITERKLSEAHMQHQALFDSLTDLSNRRLFQDRLGHAMMMAQREEKLLAVCFFDLDNFKMINDNLGHAVGDELLKSVAKRLRSTMRQGDIIARISGDEFAVAVEGLSNVDELEKIVEKLRSRLSEAYRIRGHKIYTSASIGVALYPLDSADRDTMLRNADAAMYRAKELGGNCYCYYTYDMNDKARRRLEMEKALRVAIPHNELCLYYQPQIQCGTNEVIGMEALLRWTHPEYGLLPPSKFLHIAEESGLIFSIGNWVLQTACKQLVEWRSLGFQNLRMTINMTSRQFAQEGIVDNIKQVLNSTKLDPDALCIEITESAAMKNIAGSIDILQQLKALGLRTAIDDFGAGHTSMNLLQRLPIDALSIDRSFIMRIAERGQDGNTAKGIIALAHSLGLKVAAEGVETSTQENFLTRHRCDELQVYCFSPPHPAEIAIAYLKQKAPIYALDDAVSD